MCRHVEMISYKCRDKSTIVIHRVASVDSLYMFCAVFVRIEMSINIMVILFIGEKHLLYFQVYFCGKFRIKFSHK